MAPIKRRKDKEDEGNFSDSSDENYLLSEIPRVESEIAALTLELASATDEPAKSTEDVDTADYEVYEAPEWCVPIRTDVRAFDWTGLGNAAQFDVIVMDPPWLLSSSTPTRGVAIGYSQLANNFIQDIPVEKLASRGFIFVWVINKQFAWTVQAIEKWGYRYVDEIAWVKRTVNRRLAKGHGYYLQHAKESCIVGVKGDVDPSEYAKIGLTPDVIYAERRGQSQKPEELYEFIEQLVPNGKYLEIFARKNNLRDYWVSIGNEL